MAELKKRPSGRARTKKPEAVTTQVPVVGNVAAVETFVAQLRAVDKIEKADEPMVALALTLASHLDSGAGMATAAVSRELRAVLEALPRNVDPNPLDLLLEQRKARLAQNRNRWGGVDDNGTDENTDN